MTYALSAPLQTAVFERLSEDGALSAVPVFDAPPAGLPPSLYVALGPEDVRDRSDKTGHAAQHRFAVSVVGDGGGFHLLKQTAATVEAALVGMPLSLSRGRVVSLRFERAVARRDRNGIRRRVEMTFRAFLDDI
ncbi:DUF3168 domain-containing protein [Meridianimarinicoccus aquatilis]|uniref:DUF3168 domain-containing protein n=1 Tax=Meridianimarinicoccus aquatilis TaxID=2552766 RepID=A0A4R6AW77_9RHOB|nr:DUF3168 domain-containing protein [Fluviibacterium aquatile]QIE41645.1 DUF3168 domain-containing protein [Rhodobacteraceae bacterium SC52]TDL88002.1 DUF3168 domain-containing protein [Fluviibacterium aquatile]